MGEYRDAYFVLRRGTEAAVEAIEAQNFGLAMELLKQAQCDAEDAYINAGENEC